MTANDHSPATSAAENTRERLLSAAAEILSKRGYSLTRLGDVARLAGLQPPAVYYHFTNRDDLVAEVMRAGQQRVREHVQEAVAGTHGTWMDRIDAAVEAHLRIQLELSNYAAAVTRNASHLPEGVRRAMHAESEAYHDLWRRLLAAAQREGEVRPEADIAIARMLIIGALNWSVEWWTPRRPIETVISTAQILVRRGIATA